MDTDTPLTQTPPASPGDATAQALITLRPQLSIAASHPLCPAALRVALPLLDAVLVGHHRQIAELREQLAKASGQDSEMGQPVGVLARLEQIGG